MDCSNLLEMEPQETNNEEEDSDSGCSSTQSNQQQRLEELATIKQLLLEQVHDLLKTNTDYKLRLNTMRMENTRLKSNLESHKSPLRTSSPLRLFQTPMRVFLSPFRPVNLNVSDDTDLDVDSNENSFTFESLKSSPAGLHEERKVCLGKRVKRAFKNLFKC